MRGFLVTLLLSAATAAAQTSIERAPVPVGPPKVPVFSPPFRTIPQDAVLGKIRHLQQMMVEIDGAQHLLSPGVQIRDARNALILPVGLPDATSEWAVAMYLRDSMGYVHRVWLLSEREIAALPPPPYPK